MTQKATSATKTAAPRVGVSLPPDVYALYKAFSKASGQSMSSMLAEIAITSAPALEKVLRVVVAAKEAEAARKSGFQQAAEEAEQQLLPLLAQAERTLGLALDNMHAAATQQPAGAQRAGARRAGPPPSNTGVRSPRKQGKKRGR